MRIFFIGFMGTGKTSHGRRLAKLTDMDFIDLDEYIELVEQLSISDIFEKFGEEHFRKIEQKHLRDLFNKENTVISTGGGTACYYNNIDEINNAGISIYLKMNTKALLNRIINSSQKRPLVENLTKKEAYEYIKKLLSEREVHYNKAKITIDAFNLDTKSIIPLLEKYK